MYESGAISKVHGWCHKILPLVYDDSLSYYEVLCKLRAKINEIIEEVEKVKSPAIEYVKDYVNSAEFMSYVEGIISGAISDRDTVPRSNDLSFTRLLSKVEKSSLYFTSETHYNVPQSCCYNEQEATLIVGWWCEGDTTNSKGAKLVEYDLPGMRIRREAILPIGHANGMTYDPNKKKIYVCTLNTFGDGSDPTNSGFTIVDYESFTVESNVRLGFLGIGCGMDEAKGLIYISDGNGVIHVISNSDYSEVRNFRLKFPKYRGTVYQDLDVHDGLIYCLFWRPNTINVFDLDGNNVRNYNIPRWMNQIYRFHEGEGICHMGDGYFAITGYGNYEPNHYTAEGVIGMCNFNMNVMDAPAVMLNYHSHQATYDLYVDSSASNQANINPVGDANSPFRSVQEALSSVRSPFFDGAINIYISGGVEPFPVTASGINKWVRFRGDYQMDNISINYCRGMSFGNGYKFVSTVDADACVFAYDSEIVLGDCLIQKGGCTHGIKVQSTKCILSMPNVPSPDISISGSEVRITRVDDTTKITLEDSTCFINQPINIASGQFTSSFPLRMDARTLPYATVLVSCNNHFVPFELDTNPQRNQQICIRYERQGNFVDLFFRVSFNTAMQFTIFDAYHKIDGGATVVGFPVDAFVGEVNIHI